MLVDLTSQVCTSRLHVDMQAVQRHKLAVTAAVAWSIVMWQVFQRLLWRRIVAGRQEEVKAECSAPDQTVPKSR